MIDIMCMRYKFYIVVLYAYIYLLVCLSTSQCGVYAYSQPAAARDTRAEDSATNARGPANIGGRNIVNVHGGSKAKAKAKILSREPSQIDHNRHFSEITPEGEIKYVTEGEINAQYKRASENIFGKEPWCGPLVRGLTTQVTSNKHIRFCWRDDPAAVLRPLQVDGSSILEVAVHLEKINMKPKLYSLPPIGSIHIKIRPPSREFGGYNDLFTAHVTVYPDDDLETLTQEVKDEFLLTPMDVLKFRDDVRQLFERRGLFIEGSSKAISVIPLQLIGNSEEGNSSENAEEVQVFGSDDASSSTISTVLQSRHPKRMFTIKLNFATQSDALLTEKGIARKKSHNPIVNLQLTPGQDLETIEQQFLTYFKSKKAVRSTVIAQLKSASLPVANRSEELVLSIQLKSSQLSVADQRWRSAARVHRLRKFIRRLKSNSGGAIVSALSTASQNKDLMIAISQILGYTPRHLPESSGKAMLPEEKGEVSSFSDELLILRNHLENGKKVLDKSNKNDFNERILHAFETPWYLPPTGRFSELPTLFKVDESDLDMIESDLLEFYEARISEPDLRKFGASKMAEKLITDVAQTSNRRNTLQNAEATRSRLKISSVGESVTSSDQIINLVDESINVVVSHDHDFQSIVNMIAERLLLPSHLARSLEDELSNKLSQFSIRPAQPNWLTQGQSSPSTSWVREIQKHEWRTFSQNGEDGVLDWIFRNIGTTNRYYVEFGAETGLECNTRLLKEQAGWVGLLMDGGHRSPRLNLHQEFISVDNLNYIFSKYHVPHEFDLLSIDLDFADYFVWKALSVVYKPRVVVLEVNSALPWYENRVVDPIDPLGWMRDDHYGCTLTAATLLAKSKGYTLVYVESRGVNAFFVRDDILVKGDTVVKPWPISLLARSVNHYNGRSSIHEKFNNEERNKKRQWIVNDLPLV